MPRLDPLSREEMKEFEEIFVEAERLNRHVPNFVRTMARRPEILRAHRALRKAIIGPGTVSEELKNFVSQVTSLSAGCNYCAAHTANFAVEMNIPTAKEEAIWEYETSPLFSEAERAALRVAQGGAQVPNAVTDEDFAELRRHFNDEQVVEILAVIGMFGYLNRINDTLATELESAPIKAGERFLSKYGWTVGKHSKREPAEKSQ